MEGVITNVITLAAPSKPLKFIKIINYFPGTYPYNLLELRAARYQLPVSWPLSAKFIQLQAAKPVARPIQINIA